MVLGPNKRLDGTQVVIGYQLNDLFRKSKDNRVSVQGKSLVGS